jgi:hypothetical protein
MRCYFAIIALVVSEARHYTGKREQRHDSSKSITKSEGVHAQSLATSGVGNQAAPYAIPATNIAGYWSQRHLSSSWSG